MPEDRDQLFEQALARHLRAGAAAESVCLDPEMLAAYHERTLSPEEVAAAKSHIVSCARCQQVLAQLEVTEALDELHDTELADVPVLAAAGVSVRAQPQPVSLESKSPAPREVSSKVVAIPPRKYFSLRWAAPAGAIAAGLLIWISVREFRIDIKPSAAPAAQVAENRQQAPASPAKEESGDFTAQKEMEKQKAGAASSADQLNEAPRRSHSTAAPEPLRDEKKDYATAGKLEAQDKRLSPSYDYRAQTRSGIGGGRGGPSAAAAQAQANNALQRADQGVVDVVGGAAPMAEAAPARADLDKAQPQKNQPALATKSAGASGIAKSAPAPPPPSPKPVSGHLSGTVTDPSGAAVAGASVELKSASGAPVASTSTDKSGTYSFTGVAAGNYQLELQSPGFKTDSFTGVNIAAGENVVNGRLELGTSSETVEVTAQTAVINSQAAEITAAPERKSRNLQALTLASSGLQTVASPDGKAVWKFGETGQILHSANAGKEWTAQVSGVSAKLLAASAPAAKVCWIAGAAGTLLLTTDGGKHWQRITVPISGDLGGVHASDAKHASIWDAPNRLSYETSDGGATWKQSANE
jgi:hypothetical protein